MALVLRNNYAMRTSDFPQELFNWQHILFPGSHASLAEEVLTNLAMLLAKQAKQRRRRYVKIIFDNRAFRVSQRILDSLRLLQGQMYEPWTTISPRDSIISVKGAPFRKIRMLGEGYHSVVYEANNIRTGFRCAVKVVSFAHPDPREQQDLYEMFIKEINLLIKLCNQSIHIAKIFEYDIDKLALTGKIVLELGTEDFRSLLPLRAHASAKIIPEPRRRYYWKQMVEAIRVIHLNRIAHSDVKPENFIIVRNLLKIIDFGMSFVIPAGRTTVVRPFAGTPDYMPPEICRPCGVMTKFGYKADIWSLGCILYEMSFGVRPFEHIHGDLEKMQYIGAMVKPISIPPGADPLLTNMLEWCLQSKQSKRPTAEQILSHPYITYKR